MTQQFTPNADPEPQDAAIPEFLPQQEEFYRAPARFGSIPVEAEPKGWDRRQRFEKHYPRVNLPTQIIERVSLGKNEPHEPNRLIWGDNLHVMRQIPSNSVDLIYIDPPFFSGRQYNVIWGDNNELRSFTDIWEGGLDGYLIWLNARLYEMKRMLKPTGSIYVHCDQHASHYIKMEMDKIFGYDNLIDQIVWHYGTPSGGRSSGKKPVKVHDTLLVYASDYGKHTYNRQFTPYSEKYINDWFRHTDENGRKYRTRSRNGKIVPQYLDESPGVPLSNVWSDIMQLYGSAGWFAKMGTDERIGYPTQKPEALLERIINTSSNKGDTVADFFVGGGTTAVVAQRLGRPWIACDQSRVAIAVTAERLKQQALTRGVEDASIPDFTVEQWGIYEAARLSDMPPEQFRDFVLRAYGATRIGQHDDGPHIHGWRNQLPIWVGEAPLDSQATAEDVRNFANAIRRTAQYQQANLRNGIMLAWGFGPDAVEAAGMLRQQAAVDVNFVTIAQVRIGDDGFRQHIVGRSTDKADYSEFLTFIQPPVVDVGYHALGGQSVTFDAGDTAVVNLGAEIINVQWDFHYDGQRFSATTGYSLQRDRNRRPQLKVTHKFPRTGRFTVACRVQDSRGGEAMWSGSVEVK